MARRPKLRDETAEVIDRIKEQHEYSTMDRAISHVLREQGYEV